MMMPFMNELLVTVAGGILTALILNLFSGRKTPPAQTMHQSQTAPSRGGSSFGQFIHVLLAVIGGVAISSTFGRYLFKSGILERGLPMRLLVLVVSTALVWWVLLLFRGRR